MNDRLATALARARDDLIESDALSVAERRYARIAILTALRASPDELAAEARAALEAGCTVRGLEDIIVQMAAYVGGCAASHCMQAVDHVLDAAKGGPAARTASLNDLPCPSARYEEGIADYARLDSQALANIRAAFDSLASGLIDRTFQAFGDFFASSSLDLRTRQLATCGALAAAANAAPQLQFHVGVSLALGVEKDALVAILEEVQVHAGIPAAYNGLIALKAVLAPAAATAEPVYR